MHRRTNDEVVTFALGRFGIHRRVVSRRESYRETQGMGDVYRTVSAPTCRVKQSAVSRESEDSTNGPRARP